MVEDSQRRPDRNRRAPEARTRGRSAPNIILITTGCYLDEWPPRFAPMRPDRNVASRGRSGVIWRIRAAGGPTPGPVPSAALVALGLLARCNTPTLDPAMRWHPKSKSTG